MALMFSLYSTGTPSSSNGEVITNSDPRTWPNMSPSSMINEIVQKGPTKIVPREHNVALRGTGNKLYQQNNGNFLVTLRQAKTLQIHDHMTITLGKTSKMKSSISKAITFFGVIRRIYIVFSASTQRREILLNRLPSLTVKKLSYTRWESRVESVAAKMHQTREVTDALLEVSNSTAELKTKSEVYLLAVNELESFKFTVGIVIWYDLLFAFTIATWIFHCLKVTTKSLESLVKFIKNFHEEGFLNAQITAKELAESLQIEPKFGENRIGKKVKQFDYEVLKSSKEWFGQLAKYSEIFSFLFSLKSLKYIQDEELKMLCKNLKKEPTVNINGEC
ncbi:uncharacterized protein LOC126474558 [Schistocerca serialis cubense]|uniref:uncharacterized protein LOC126474558 n=1 Tax=Schistocerca serialis cubense TaxID=2023355 RepID=UPI00214E5834|nr:uncharacterized protein LOC126474558 [Schistocerca serialis cubense]